jgi:tetratricopeptide (TPR) repeat protein
MRYLLLLLPVGLLAADEPHRHDLGRVHFPVSCSPATQKTFDTGVALLHSFWYSEAENTFEKVVHADPSCAMGYWGIAMTFYHPVWAPPSAEDLRKGAAAVAHAKSVKAKTERERDYIAAIEVFYRDAGKLSHRERAMAWRNAMRQLSAKYPRDSEAAIFFALALIATAPAGDKTYADQKQAAEILNRILPDQPDHPGIAHYLIHGYDSPALAALALPAARSYARIAPGSAHALHMPSHIFTRLGLWQESIDSNLASVAAAKSSVVNTLPGVTAQDQLHAMDYLEYSYLQTCHDTEAKQVVGDAAAVSKLDQQVFQAANALAAIPARYALERRRWSAASELPMGPAWFPWAQFRFAEAITHFARAIGAARSGNLRLARAEIQELANIHAALAKSSEDYDWATQAEIQRLAASGWLAHAEGHNEAALSAMQAAADLEDSTEKHPVTPGPVLPAREMLGELFMELNRPALALPEFERVLKSSPKRFNATYGAARAAELSGDRVKAKERYAELLGLCGQRGSGRLEVQNARAFLGSGQ